MNIRKFLCRIFHGWGWLYRTADCKRYEPAPPPLPPEPPQPPPPPPPTEYISIKVCTVSGLLPNAYCPKTKEGQFIKGQEPKAKCASHTEPPKPKRPTLFIGTSVYELLEFPDDDIAWFLEKLYGTGANCTEIFASYTWSLGAMLQPYLKVGDLYDLTVPNPAYWAKLKFIMAKCAELDIVLIVRLFDYCSIKNEDYYKLLCWHSNRQKKEWQGSGKPWGGFYGTKPKEYYAAYIKAILDLAKETKCTIHLEGVNEADYKPSRGEIEKWIDRTLPADKKEWNLTADELTKISRKSDEIILKFHAWILQELDKYGYSLQYISTNVKYQQSLNWANQQGILYEVHGCNSPEAVNDVYTKYGFNNACPNGDGPDPNAQGRQDDKPEKREPSVAQGAAIGKILKDKKAKIFCFFNRATEQVKPFDLKRATFDVIGAIIKATL